MEATREPVPQQQQQIHPEAKTLGNTVPNSFAELEAMRQNTKPYPNTSFPFTFTLFAKSMNLPKDTCTVRMPKSVDKKKYQIPPSEYIWDAPYLKKTQIFPSYVRNYIFIIY